MLLRIDPVALQALAVIARDDPTALGAAGEKPVVVRQVNEPALRQRAAQDVPRGSRIRPRGGAGLINALRSNLVINEPIALQTLTKGRGHKPTGFPEPAVVIGVAHASVGTRRTAAQNITGRGGVVCVAGRRVPLDGGMRIRVNPVTLQPLAISGRDDPAASLAAGEHPIVVGEVDPPVGGIRTTDHVALGAGIRPNPFGNVNKLARGDLVSLEPIALQPLAEVRRYQPARLGKKAVVVSRALGAVGGRRLPAQDVAVLRRVVRPAIGREALLGRMCLGVNPIALKALAIGGRDDPAAVLAAGELAVVVGQINVSPIVRVHTPEDATVLKGVAEVAIKRVEEPVAEKVAVLNPIPLEPAAVVRVDDIAGIDLSRAGLVNRPVPVGVPRPADGRKRNRL